MKIFKTLTISVVIFGTTVYSQIPNNGFENWTNMGAYDVPDSWGTMNNKTDVSAVYTATIGTPGSPGTSYLKLTSKTVGLSVVNGIACSGQLDTMNMKPISGFAYTGQPISFTGKWQHMIYGSSQGGITVVLTKWNTALNKRDTVAIANQTLSGMAMSWANFSIPFSYSSSIVPDSCIIFLRASGSSPTVDDYLWVDNLAFSGSVAAIESNELAVNNISVYPNPASDLLIISFEVAEPKNVTLELVGINGKIVLSENLGMIEGNRNETISILEIPAGSYIINLISESGSQSHLIVIE